jgi:hypothetical protein
VRFLSDIPSYQETLDVVKAANLLLKVSEDSAAFIRCRLGTAGGPFYKLGDAELMVGIMIESEQVMSQINGFCNRWTGLLSVWSCRLQYVA